MKYLLLLVLLFFQLSSPAQKLKKPTKKDPPGTVRITDFQSLSPNKWIILGIGKETRYPLGFKILETDSLTIQLFFQGGSSAGQFNIKKGSLVKIYFTDSSMITLPAVKDAPSTGYRDKEGGNNYFANGYYELNKKMQQLFISKEVESVRMHEYLYHKVDKKNGDLIGKALQLFN
ncbi:MAG TPA: hypothetical protein VN451_11175 [Chitinophagaceae bacterium]|nr:hypothetical protein [Chitinophagaceae bacterium]